MNVKNIVKPNTLKDRLLQFCFISLGTILILFGFVFLYSRQINNRYENTIYSMNLLREYYEELSAVQLAQKGFLYYEGRSDYIEAEEAYRKIEETLERLSTVYTDKKCYYEIINLREMTKSMRHYIEEIYDAMERYHDGETENLEEVNAKYESMYEIYNAINSEYVDVNDSMLSYGNKIYYKVRAQRKTAGILIGIAMAVSGFLLYNQVRKINYSVVVPIQELINYAQNVKDGNFVEENILANVEMDREMAMLTEVFESMVLQLRNQIDTLENNIAVQIELQESRFKALQLQINPHFMFNTLNMLMENAYLEQADTTASLLKITAKMFRYSLDFSGRAVTLFREMEELGNYVLIQEQRYGERIRFEFELDERFHHITVPALILQPLVENAVVHGVGNRLEGALIRIETKYFEENDGAEIMIEDNGFGMDPAELDRLQNNMENYNSGSSAKIGLGNVHMRLKMYFGDRVAVKLESEKGKGTKVRIGLKQILGGEENVPSVDCG